MAVGRLVYDFNSASEFNDKDGASLLTEILSSYVATADKWESALSACEAKGDNSRPEGVDEPDANLGQCLMDSLCSVSEHGDSAAAALITTFLSPLKPELSSTFY